MKATEKKLTAQEAYLGHLTASSMADALFKAGDFRGPCGSRTKHSFEIKEQSKSLAVMAANKLANTTGDIDQFDIDYLQGLNWSAKTGLDRFMPWGNPDYRHNKAVLLNEVRRLRNDSRKLFSLALALNDGDTIGFISLAMNGPVPQDYKKWAEGLAYE